MKSKFGKICPKKARNMWQNIQLKSLNLHKIWHQKRKKAGGGGGGKIGMDMWKGVQELLWTRNWGRGIGPTKDWSLKGTWRDDMMNIWENVVYKNRIHNCFQQSPMRTHYYIPNHKRQKCKKIILQLETHAIWQDIFANWNKIELVGLCLKT